MDVLAGGGGGGGGGAGEEKGGKGNEKMEIEVYRTFLGHVWDEKGVLKGSSSPSSSSSSSSFSAGSKTASGESGGGKQGDGVVDGKEEEDRQEDVRVELEVLGRKEYYSSREGCMCLSHPIFLLSLSMCVPVRCDSGREHID